jgi:cytochrome b561
MLQDHTYREREMTETSQARYSTGAIIFHWLIAIGVIANWRIAESAEHLEGAAKAAAIAPHKAIGITILALTLLRLIWRFTHKPPPLSESLAGWEKFLVRAIHAIFYILLIALPIGGWMAGSHFEMSISYFGLFDIPPLPVAADPEAGKAVLGQHKAGGEILLILVALHIVGALKHSFYDKVSSLSRMWFARQ